MNPFKMIKSLAEEREHTPVDGEKIMVEFISKSWRAEQWSIFSYVVHEHIDSYTVPQYGDMPNDQASEFTLEEIAMNMKRYINRICSNARGHDEAKRDMLKIAHYACLAFAKMVEDETEGKDVINVENDSA